MTGDRDRTGIAGWLACTINVAMFAGAVCVVLAEGWDMNGDGVFTAHEALLILVRLLAFPVHMLLQLMPGPVLQLLGLHPDALWPSSAVAAVALSLPLWGVLIFGVLVLEAWLATAWEAIARHDKRAERA